MANKLSSKKSIRKIKFRTAVNKNRLSRIKTYIKKVYQECKQPDNAEQAGLAFVKVQSELSRGAQKGAITKNRASRTISRLAAKLKQSINSK